MSEREKVIECIKALSKIEGINRYIEGQGLKQNKTIFESIDLIMKYGKVKGTIVANIFLHNLKRMDCPIACSETISNKIYE